MWKRKPKGEWLPWYRARDYKGDLTEAEKRQLDAFRMQPKHPAACEEDLPEEVREYIGRIELELYDKKQDEAAGYAVFWSVLGAVLLFLIYKGVFGPSTPWSYAAAVFAMVVPWLVYRYQWKKNAEEFLPKVEPRINVTDEEFRKEWELNHIVRNRQAKHGS
jgi:hypothetical protein